MVNTCIQMRIILIILLIMLLSCEKEHITNNLTPCIIYEIELKGYLSVYGQRTGCFGYEYVYYCEMINDSCNTESIPVLLYSDSVYKKIMKFDLYKHEILTNICYERN